MLQICGMPKSGSLLVRITGYIDLKSKCCNFNGLFWQLILSALAFSLVATMMQIVL
jgi:hypothetical protein